MTGSLLCWVKKLKTRQRIVWRAKWKTRRVGHPRVLEISHKAVFIHTVTIG